MWTGGTNRDVGSLALMLIANWFINGQCPLVHNHLCLGPQWRILVAIILTFLFLLCEILEIGETVLIDGGVS